MNPNEPGIGIDSQRTPDAISRVSPGAGCCSMGYLICCASLSFFKFITPKYSVSLALILVALAELMLQPPVCAEVGVAGITANAAIFRRLTGLRQQ